MPGIEFHTEQGLLCFAMKMPPCPVCTMTELLDRVDRWEFVTCGHEWEREADASDASDARVVVDAHGTTLSDGDSVALIKDLKLKGSSETLKSGTKTKSIRLVEGDHEISCRMNGTGVGLKACFVKKI